MDLSKTQTGLQALKAIPAARLAVKVERTAIGVLLIFVGLALVSSSLIPAFWAMAHGTSIPVVLPLVGTGVGICFMVGGGATASYEITANVLKMVFGFVQDAISAALKVLKRDSTPSVPPLPPSGGGGA